MSLGVGIADAIASGCDQAHRLGQLLEDEFNALKVQDLPAFELLQPEKEQILVALARVLQRVSATDSAAAAVGLPQEAGEQWAVFQTLMGECQAAHRRNDILIRSKLETIRATLRILQSGENTGSVEVYDRMGKVSSLLRGRGYDDA